MKLIISFSDDYENITLITEEFSSKEHLEQVMKEWVKGKGENNYWRGYIPYKCIAKNWVEIQTQEEYLADLRMLPFDRES